MSGDTNVINPPDERVHAVLAGMKRIAVIGISEKEDRASHGIARFLVGKGFEVVGVNPVLDQPVLGIEVYPTLADVPGTVDVVDVFRPSSTRPSPAATPACGCRKASCTRKPPPAPARPAWTSSATAACTRNGCG
jgi:hypothetical protein